MGYGEEKFVLEGGGGGGAGGCLSPREDIFHSVKNSQLPVAKAARLPTPACRKEKEKHSQRRGAREETDRRFG